ncbi:ABC transporter i family member 10 chloroplastic [Phtheirospermum japonicum]|uniref:ABC transporter i family member 10 chloroplastic n=1 Tax=Phtheirospermum japonicum TaxID=374723 RepID=A0A830D3I7_9LAMI|nr:ABC transporter i family member 10 chloroplastic [Phtheirospermum japonicum]
MNSTAVVRATAAVQLPLLRSHTDGNSFPVSIAAENLAIDCRNLSYSVKTRQGKLVPILNDCSLSIPAGQFWMLLGPNGCGKSTLLKVHNALHIQFFVTKFSVQLSSTHIIYILGGLLNPSSGYLRVNKPRSFVFQNPDHQVVMPTVEADVAFGMGKLNIADDEITSRVAKALDAVGIPVQTLSGGQKQRVAIAGALAEACKVLLLDELTSFLDENDQVGVLRAVKSSLASSSGTTALWVTHRLEELEYADGAVYMEDGKPISFNRFIFQKEEKLVVMWYLDVFESIFKQMEMRPASPSIRKFMKKVVLSHFGIKRIKKNLIYQIDETQEYTDESINLSRSVMSFRLNIPDKDKVLKMIRDIVNARLASPRNSKDDLLEKMIEDMKTANSPTQEFITHFLFSPPFAMFQTIPSIRLGIMACHSTVRLDPNIYKDPVTFNLGFGRYLKIYLDVGSDFICENLKPFGRGIKQCGGRGDDSRREGIGKVRIGADALGGGAEGGGELGDLGEELAGVVEVFKWRRTQHTAEGGRGGGGGGVRVGSFFGGVIVLGVLVGREVGAAALDGVRGGKGVEHDEILRR